MVDHDVLLTGKDPWRGAALVLGLTAGLAFVDLLWIALTHVGLGHHPAVAPSDLALRMGMTALAILGVCALRSHWRISRPVVLLWAVVSLLQLAVRTAADAEQHIHRPDVGILLLPAVQMVGVLGIAGVVWYLTRSRAATPTPALS